jgi:hypothetical protein
MILHFGPGGRVGNQLFELAYIEAVRGQSEWVLCTRLVSSLKCVVRMPRYLDFEGRIIVFLVKKILRPLVENCLVPLRIFSCHWEKTDGSVAMTRGLLPVTYLKGYYQFGSIATKPRQFRIRKYYLEAAGEIVKEAGRKIPLFVHVRRGDYLTYEVGQHVNPSLPVTYYDSAVHTLLAQVQDPFFFFLGDEPEWIAPQFAHLPHATVVRRSAPLDLAVMSLCAGGVISNSTFAWWGAALCKRNGPIIAPRFWLGWRSRDWYPPLIGTKAFTFIDVRPESAHASRDREILTSRG